MIGIAKQESVTSLAEVWIETRQMRIMPTVLMVTSLAEVWIETMCQELHVTLKERSLPLRKCGLKLLYPFGKYQFCVVTSLAEVWIETTIWYQLC